MASSDDERLEEDEHSPRGRSPAHPPSIPSSLYGHLLSAYGLTDDAREEETANHYGADAVPRIAETEPEAEPIFAPGPTEQRYKLGELLFASGLRELYAAYDEATDEEVTVEKLVEGADPAEAANVLRQELLLARSATHPNIVRVHDLVNLPWGPALVHEKVRGSLRSRLEHVGGRQFDANDVRTLGRDVAAALKALHASNLVHGAVSPERIWLTDEDRAKMSMASMVTERERILLFAPPSSVLNDTYHSPERLVDPSPSYADDIYALGLVLWEMLTLCTPGSGMNPRLRSAWENNHTTTLFGFTTDELRTIYAALSPESSLRPTASEFLRAMEVGSGRASLPGDTRIGVDPGPPPAMKASSFLPGQQALIVTYASTAADQVGRVWSLDRPEVTVGRHRCDIEMPERTLSGRHAALRWQGGSWTVRDLGSANGTYGDGSNDRQRQLQLLHGGDIQLGETRLALVHFTEGSPRHRQARRYLHTHDGLTGLLHGRHFVSVAADDLSFSRWADVPMYVVAYRVRFGEQVRWVNAMTMLRSLAHHVITATRRTWPGPSTAGSTLSVWPRRPQHARSVFVTMLGKGAPTIEEATRTILAGARATLPKEAMLRVGVATRRGHVDISELFDEAREASEQP